jgi:hypothetical protein
MIMKKFFLVILLVLVSVIVLIFGASLIGNWLFNKKVEEEIEAFWVDTNAYLRNSEVVTEADLANLPAIVQKWMEHSRVTGKERIETVYLHQKASLRLGNDKPWLPAEADQYFKISEPGFIWKATIMMNPLLKVVGRDMYHQGKGHMLIKALSLIPVANARGEEIDQGTMLRFMGEMSWFPVAALSDYLKWEEIDSNSARATMNYGGVTASGIFRFSDEGRILSFTAKRYMENHGRYSLEDWVVEAKDYKEFGGIEIPHKVDVTWQLEAGDYHWFSCEVTDIEYNHVGLR